MLDAAYTPGTGARWLVIWVLLPAALVCPVFAARGQPVDQLILATPRSKIKSVMIREYEYKNEKFKKTHGEQYIFNKDGKPAVYRLLDKKNVVLREVKYSYNDAHEIIAFVDKSKSGEETKTFKRTFTYTHDDNGRIAEILIDAPDLKEVHHHVYIYYPEGGYAIIKYRKAPSDDPNEHEFGSEKYDKEGRLTSSCSVGYCSMNEYDDKGNIKRQRMQGVGEDHWYLVHDNTYDEKGRLISVVTGGMETAYSYNEKGDVAEEMHHQAKEPERKYVYAYTYRKK